MKFSFRKESDRNTKCYSFRCGELTCFVSYETIVAFRYPGKKLRLHNYWGPTTGRHMKEMAVHDWPEAESTAEFERELDAAFAHMVRDDVARILTREPEYVVG